MGLIEKIEKGFWESAFRQNLRRLASTPPLRIRPAKLTFVSMVSKKDLWPYLLTIKSIYRYIGEGHVCVLMDPTFDAECRAIAETHIPGIEFVAIADVDTGKCQRGGTWERLCLIMDRSRDHYIVQADSDILAVRDTVEIRTAVTENRSFAMGQLANALGPMLEAVALSRNSPWKHVTHVSQANFDRYPGAERLRYVLGSSGLSGFACGGFDRERLEHFSETMRGLIGDIWLKWGSEQVGSNFAVANSPNPIALPWPKYACNEPTDADLARETACFHFIGIHRFRGPLYARLTHEVISELAARR